MTITERIDALIAKLPAMAKAHPELVDFWHAVDAEMEPIVAQVDTGAEQRALDARYHDVITKADVLGMIRED